MKMFLYYVVKENPYAPNTAEYIAGPFRYYRHANNEKESLWDSWRYTILKQEVDVN